MREDHVGLSGRARAIGTDHKIRVRVLVHVTYFLFVEGHALNRRSRRLRDRVAA